MLFCRFFLIAISLVFSTLADVKAENDTLDSGKKSSTTNNNATLFTTVGFGPAIMYNFGNQKLAYNVFGGKFWTMNDLLGLGFTADIISDLENSILISASIASSYFPFKTEISPYVTGETGLGYAHGKDKNAFGLSMAALLGVAFFRNMNVQLNAGIKAAVLLDKFPDGFPGSIQARIGLLF